MSKVHMWRTRRQGKYNARGGYYCLSCFNQCALARPKKSERACGSCGGCVAWFASGMEYSHYINLKLLERGGFISNVEHQIRFPIVIRGKKVGSYIADFQFFDKQQQQFRIQDTKGVETDASRFRRRCAEAVHGIEVEIVTSKR